MSFSGTEPGGVYELEDLSEKGSKTLSIDIFKKQSID